MEPACTQDEGVQQVDPKSTANAIPAQRIILLVEDEDFVREVTREVLLYAGYKVLSARDIGEALQAFTRSEQAISLVMADHKLPDGDGCSMACRLVAAHPDVRAMIISGYPRNKLHQGERKQPGITYLAKPFSTDILLGAVRRALGETSEPPPLAKTAAAS